MKDLMPWNLLEVEQAVNIYHGDDLEDGTYLFRYIDRRQCGSIFCERFKVIRRTPAGYKIKDDWGRERFVLEPCGGGRRYAYPTRQDAWDSFKIRKSRQIQHAQNTIDHCRKMMKGVETEEKARDEASGKPHSD